MASSQKKYPILISWVITLVIPILLILGAVRVVLNPWYLEFEYRTPNFPPDEFGFSLQDRLYYSRYALDYLGNNADISYLGELRFPEGQTVPAWSCQYMTDCNLMYNERELKHMVDVKKVVKAALAVFYISLVGMALSGVWAWRGRWWGDYQRGLWRGGWLTVTLIGVIIIAVLFLFNFFFVFFHSLFFSEGTWIFYTSDTLIRLFPERFWRDTFIMVGGITSVVGLFMGFFLKKAR